MSFPLCSAGWGKSVEAVIVFSVLLGVVVAVMMAAVVAEVAGEMGSAVVLSLRWRRGYRRGAHDCLFRAERGRMMWAARPTTLSCIFTPNPRIFSLGREAVYPWTMRTRRS